MPVSFLLPYLLGPALFGAYKFVNLAISFARFDNLGAHISLNLEIPKILKAGNNGSPENLIGTVVTFDFFTRLLTVLLAWIIYQFDFEFKEFITLDVLIAVSILILISRVNEDLSQIAFGYGMFSLMAKREFYVSVAFPVLVLPSIIFFKLAGVFYSMLLVELATAISIFNVMNVKIIPKINKTVLFKSITLGFSISLHNFGGSLFRKSTSALVFTNFSMQLAGVFALAMSLLEIAANIVDSINKVLIRDMVLNNNLEDENRVSFSKYFGSMFWAYLYLSGTIFASGYFAFTFLVEVILTEFLEALIHLKILAFGFFFLRARGITFAYLMATNQFRFGHLSQAIAICVLLGFGYFAIHQTGDMRFVSLTATLVFTLFSFWILGFVLLQIFNNWIDVGRALTKLALSQCIGYSLMLFIDKFLTLDELVSYTTFENIVLGVLIVTCQVIIFSASLMAIYVIIFWREKFHVICLKAFGQTTKLLNLSRKNRL